MNMENSTDGIRRYLFKLSLGLCAVVYIPIILFILLIKI